MKRDFITILALMIALSSCNDDALFEKEMYKNVVALISSDYYNTFEEVVTLSPTGEEATGYIAACTGGTHAPKQNMVIGLEEDLTSLEFYNRSLYDVDEACYAKFLSSDKYEIVDYKIQINAGERTGRTMIKIRPEGLSPDSTYFVGNKKMFPLTHNSVRVIAGTESFESNVDHINKTAIILQVEENNHVTIKPYKDIEVTQIDGDSKYPNTFKVEESFGHTYNVFLLSYRYTKDGKSKVMQEELRLEINN